MEAACQEARDTKTLSYRSVKAVLEMLQLMTTPPTAPLPLHENIRGKTYYQ